MSTSANNGPGYSKHPEHRVDTSPAGVRVRVTFDDAVIADTRDAIKLEESGYPPVYYVPRRDVQMDFLTRTDHRTYCPFKGNASYFSRSDRAERDLELRAAVRRSERDQATAGVLSGQSRSHRIASRLSNPCPGQVVTK